MTAVVAALGGARALLLEDHRYRVLAWLTLATVIVGWTTYYVALDTKAFRISLEVLSTVALIAAVLRIRWLIRVQGMRSPLLTGLAKFPSVAWRAIGSPWLIAAKVWIMAMIVMEWRGKADFSTLEYAVVSGILLATAAGQFLVTRRAKPQFSGLEALASESAPAACPFGFGCDAMTGEQDPAHKTTRDA